MIDCGGVSHDHNGGGKWVSDRMAHSPGAWPPIGYAARRGIADEIQATHLEIVADQVLPPVSTIDGIDSKKLVAHPAFRGVIPKCMIGGL